MDESEKVRLPEPDVTKPEEFRYRQAKSLAEKSQKDFALGDIPSVSIKQQDVSEILRK